MINPTRILGILGAGLLTYGGTLAAQKPASQPDFEPPPVFKASEILADVPEMLSGEHFTVREEVLNDGYWDFYTIDTPFGVFYAHGWLDLRETLREIEAIAKIESMTKTQAFTDALIEQGLEPLEFVGQVIMHPVQTVKNIPGGIKQMFQRYARRAKEVIEVGKKVVGADDDDDKPKDTRLAEACAAGNEPYPGACDEEGYADDFKKLARRYFDVTDEIRDFHAELGTDPYSSNEVLQNAIKNVSWAGGIGKFGIKKANPLRRVKEVGLVTKVHKYAWNMEPFRLRDELIRILTEAGVPHQERQYFLNNPFMTPTKQAFIVLALAEMDNVGDRMHVLHWAADSRNEDEALFSMATVASLAWYHEHHPAVRFLPGTVMPLMELEDGRLITMLPIDHLSWTEEVSTILQAAMLNEEIREHHTKTVWLLVRASDRARSELEQLGVTVIEDGYKEMLATGEDLEFDDPVTDEMRSDAEEVSEES